jgi:hypothetical protein
MIFSPEMNNASKWVINLKSYEDILLKNNIFLRIMLTSYII